MDGNSARRASAKPDEDAAVSIRQVGRQYRSGFVALDAVDLSIRNGEMIALVGPSGCGKSTLLKIIAGLLTATVGEVSFSGGKRPETGYVFQDPHLLPWRQTLGNVEFFLEVDRMKKSERQRRAREALSLVGLSEFERAYPRELSGGMKMRVSLARTLATEPQLMLFDEPFAAVDEITRHRLNDDLLRLQRGRNVTGVFVTHSITESVFLADRVAVMCPSPGRIVDVVDVPFAANRPAALRTSAEFGAVVRTISEMMELETDR
ncbi:MAG: hypothetical protein CL466_13075 [Acidimicrobiaceae bacterium]|nr:hypothetical protein [Acidimicrobiaceae bacterium]MBJ32311.1 hypothetical protein [Acidimicrobiaceae bacterium]|tara:strand:+ start:2966 stop:3754 length:789 start_codon:yes stop_codon:yes gene_type:complete